MLDHLFDQVKAFRREVPCEDDVTAVIVKATAPVVAEPSRVEERSLPTEKLPIAVSRVDYEYFQVEQQGDVDVLQIREKEILSPRKCMEIKNELVGYINDSEPSRVVVDFQTVERFSSEGINMCFKIKSALDTKNGILRLCGIHPQLREAFKALNLDGTVFEIHDDVGNALKSF